jgi:hypothetical protein
MKLVPPKPTPAEKTFDRTREEAFSNEGARPPRRESPLAANADAFDDAMNAGALAVALTSTDTLRSAGEPAAKPDANTPDPGGPVSATVGAPPRE